MKNEEIIEHCLKTVWENNIIKNGSFVDSLREVAEMVAKEKDKQHEAELEICKQAYRQVKKKKAELIEENKNLKEALEC